VDIYQIAEGAREGDMDAARGAFAQVGATLGEVIAMTVSITDGLVVIGGGLAGAYKYMKDAMFETLHGKMHRLNGEAINKLAFKVYDLDDADQCKQFIKGEQKSIKIYNSEIEVTYDPQKRIGIALSKIGANKAVSLGAYAFALNQLSR
jgi:predicted NBD/HSP70 family sugar kinase